jgi:UDP:flavonoid glycosyltransferase YjiC (YdhE family)
MRVLMVAWGSRGDVQPYLALGRGLARAGYRVTVAAATDFEPLVKAADLGFAPFDISLDASQDPVIRRWLTGSDQPWRELANMRAAVERFAPVFADGVVAALGQADALVCGLLSIPALQPWARREGRPLVAAVLQPGVPTRRGTSLLHPARPSATSSLNLASGWVQLLAMNQTLSPAVRAVHRRLELPAGRARDHIRAVTRTPTVLGASPLVVPPAPDWPAQLDVTGYWVQPVPAGYRPPPLLAEFLSAGTPPLYLGFGSMPLADPDAMRELVAQALPGRRLVLGGGLHQGPEEVATLGDETVSVAGVPHEWLFPRTAGVVCHGGAGTTAAALRSGVPVAVVPHMGDQAYWGRRVHELGLGPAPVPLSALTAGRLAGLVAGFGDPGLLAHTTRSALRLREERGVEEAVSRIREVFG